MIDSIWLTIEMIVWLLSHSKKGSDQNTSIMLVECYINNLVHTKDNSQLNKQYSKELNIVYMLSASMYHIVLGSCFVVIHIFFINKCKFILILIN